MKLNSLGLLFLLAASSLAHAQNTDCRLEKDDLRRLACYDSAAGASRELSAAAAPPAAVPAKAPSVLAERWELQPEHKTGTFQFRYYEPIYILPVKYTQSVNRNPTSPSQGSVSSALAPLGVDQLSWEDVEAKFQLSFKVKAWENMTGSNGDLWFAYTQQSYWQVYNKDVSAPFRETNFAPELINTWRTDVDFGSLTMRMVNLGFVHQSNGKSSPVSRSWNRVYAQAGFDRGNFSLLVRPWVRLKEDAEKDDNPDIEDYIGRGDIVAAYRLNKHVLSMTARHTLRTGENSRGAVQLDWAFPISGSLRGYFQLFSGFGESLIDYNHRQTVLGLGVSLGEW